MPVNPFSAVVKQTILRSKRTVLRTEKVLVAFFVDLVCFLKNLFSLSSIVFLSFPFQLNKERKNMTVTNRRKHQVATKCRFSFRDLFFFTFFCQTFCNSGKTDSVRLKVKGRQQDKISVFPPNFEDPFFSRVGKTIFGRFYCFFYKFSICRQISTKSVES